MIHFFIKPKIHLDCFTSERDVIEYAPIVPAIDVIPTWWKNLPKEYVNPENQFSPSPTMKTCSGVIDYYTKSIAIPLWSELAVKINNDKSFFWQFSDGASEGVCHDKKQYDGFDIGNNYGHLKIFSPWVFATKEDVNWLMSDPIYNKENQCSYFLAPGVLNFKHQPSTNLQILIDVSKEKTCRIPFGTPTLLTPMSNKEIVIHRHLVSKEIFHAKRSLSATITFINKYRNQKKIKRCPFHDHLGVK